MLFVWNFWPFCWCWPTSWGCFCWPEFWPDSYTSPWPKKWKHLPKIRRTSNITSSNKNHLPPKKGAVRSNQLVFYFLHLHPEKENTASVHSGPFQRIHAPQQQRRVTWRWIFRFCSWIWRLWFLFGKEGCVQHGWIFLEICPTKK